MAPAETRQVETASIGSSRNERVMRQPSSRCSNKASAKNNPASEGAQAASSTGMAPEVPNWLATSETMNSAKPQATPETSMVPAPPRREGRMENPAATSAMVAQSKGSAARAWKASSCWMAEKPERLSKAMKLGRAKKERESGEAKLSCTRFTVRSVGNSRLAV